MTGAAMSNVADLGVERQARRAPNPPDVIPSQTEREAGHFISSHRPAHRANAIARYPDLAERIRHAYGYATITQWTGFIPPRDNGGRYNTSPLRRTVVEACAEAWRRENQPARTGTP